MKSSTAQKLFNKRANNIAFDTEHRQKINFNISKYDQAVENGKSIFRNQDIVRTRAAYIRHKVISELDKNLIEFEDNFIKNGGKVIWARDAEEAVREIIGIAKKHELKSVVKSKSMITEEIELNNSLEEAGIETLETDLGEFIVQQAGEKPYHIVTPAMHKSKEDVAELYHQKFNTDINLTPEELTLYTRQLLREKFCNADLGITGANFLIADIGGIALTENEGNGILSMSFPKVHIAIAGIEKILPALENLDLFWPLLATSGTGQHMTVYNSIITGPGKKNEKDGPEEMYMVLLDNGRSKLLAEERQRQALSCIKCGACLNACPVYKNIGGHAYETTYTGPIGAVITPHLKDFNSYKHLSFASSLCGSCSTVCPVKIPLHELLLVNRNMAIKKHQYTIAEKQSIKLSTAGMKSRKMMNMLSGKSKNNLANNFLKKSWGPNRDLPHFAGKSFNEQWKEKESGD